TCERATFSECLGQHEIKTPVGCSSRQSSSKVLAIIGQVEASDWLNRETQRGAHSLGQKVELHASPEISTSIAETDIHKWSVVVERNSSVWNLCGNDRPAGKYLMNSDLICIDPFVGFIRTEEFDSVMQSDRK